jgi:hypothetical protein
MTRTERRSRRPRRGVFLVQAMVLVMILAITATGMLWLSFGRRVLISRADESESSQQLASGAQSLAQACLDGTTYGRTDCSVPPAAAACFPSAISGRSVSITASGAPPRCRLQVIVSDQQ